LSPISSSWLLTPETLTAAESLRVWTQTFASPLQNARQSDRRHSGFFQQIWNFRSTASENEQLEERLTQVETELHTPPGAAENERLKALLNLNEQSDIKNVPARVIARDPSCGSTRSRSIAAAVRDRSQHAGRYGRRNRRTHRHRQSLGVAGHADY
jgi:cell shape-determining protein MreC